MNTPSKDQSIVTQVAAKIAADLTPKSNDVLQNIADWTMAFDAVNDALSTKALSAPASEPTVQQATDTAVQQIMQAFPNTTVVQDAGFSIRVKGTQHGPLPEWLAAACKAKGVTEVWDNRDKLSVNPKRPWFKSTTSEDAFWAPRGK